MAACTLRWYFLASDSGKLRRDDQKSAFLAVFFVGFCAFYAFSLLKKHLTSLAHRASNFEYPESSIFFC